MSTGLVPSPSPGELIFCQPHRDFVNGKWRMFHLPVCCVCTGVGIQHLVGVLAELSLISFFFLFF